MLELSCSNDGRGKWCCLLSKDGRIPSTEALAYRGVPNISTSCGYCDFGVENVDYILVGCPFAKAVCDCIWRWCGIKQNTITDIGGLLKFVGLWGRCPKKHTRNDRIFNKHLKSASLVTDEIISTVFLWLKHRDFIVRVYLWTNF
uniref:Reverse transcriptase zinc-binding domain-containing protein n=1 Tax=Lactuca sativa TaxID=4236 RepID=A0A9R1VZY6_LACSA|nr:hypothetical protein LSAT_V11C400226760 [Lactuca sativa]